MTIMNAWTTAVTIHLPDIARPLIVNSANEAAAVLADKWPTTYGRRYQRALSACAAVAEKHMLEDDARSAFMDAAEEAGVSAEDGAATIITVPDLKASTSDLLDISLKPIYKWPSDSDWNPPHIGNVSFSDIGQRENIHEGSQVEKSGRSFLRP
jgi:hypothetical protein